MPWNLFERIISAFKPSKEHEQVPQVPEEQQSWPEGTEWPEGGTEQREGSQESSPSFQETPGGTQQDEWQE